jgi:hypothetical protein
MRSIIPLVCSILALTPACTGSSSTGATQPPTAPITEVTPTPETSPSTAPSAACPNQERVISDASARIGGSLEGDLDGDGSAERVSLAFDERGPHGCQAFIAVEGPEVAGVLAIERFDPALGLPHPRLHGLAEVDTVPGSEVIVDLIAGASTQFVGLFTMPGGELARVAVEGDQFPADDLFPYGGSVGHVEASDCARDPGTVVVSIATPRGVDYRVSRRFFTFVDSAPRMVHSSTERERVAFEDLGRFPEYVSSPFGACS